MKNPIKNEGEFHVKVKLFEQVNAEVKVVVTIA